MTGVPVTLDVRDNNGVQNGSTDTTRVFDPRQGYEVVETKVLWRRTFLASFGQKELKRKTLDQVARR